MRRRRPTKLGLELLERRDLLASLDFSEPPVYYWPEPIGNVTAEVIDGTLFVRGDGGSNHINIEGDGRGTYYLASAGQDTLINGCAVPDDISPIEPIILAGITRGIDIDMGDGNDLVHLYGKSLPAVTIKTGDGFDIVRIAEGGGLLPRNRQSVLVPVHHDEPAVIDGDLIVDMGELDDQLFPFAIVKGNATIRMGDGNDGFLEPKVALNGNAIKEELHVEGSSQIDLGAGNDDPLIAIDWRTYPPLRSIIDQRVVEAFDEYANSIRMSSVPSDHAQAAPREENSQPPDFTADGRMQVEITFRRGDAEVVKRLHERGVHVEEADDGYGIAYVSIREDELALLANLPSISSIHPRGSHDFGPLPGLFEDVSAPYEDDHSGEDVGAQPDNSPELVPSPLPNPATHELEKTLLAESSANTLAAYGLQLTDLNGSPITHLAPGEDFVLHAYVKDVREAPQGVFAAFIDVQWDPALATVVDSVQHTPDYASVARGDSSIAGLVSHVGGVGATIGYGGQVLEVFSVRMRAGSAGNLVFTTSAVHTAEEGLDPRFYSTLDYGVNRHIAEDEVLFRGAELVIETPKTSATELNDSTQVVVDTATGSETVAIAAEPAPSSVLSMAILSTFNNPPAGLPLHSATEIANAALKGQVLSAGQIQEADRATSMVDASEVPTPVRSRTSLASKKIIEASVTDAVDSEDEDIFAVQRL